jgi:hypothetical protein
LPDLARDRHRIFKEFWSTTRIPPICCVKLFVVQTIISPTTHSQLTCLSLVRCKFFLGE